MRIKRVRPSYSKEILQEESDEELRELAKMELSEMEDMVEPLESELKILLLPKDPNDDKNVIVISHRLANVMPADNIYFMENGEIKESGEHTALIRDKHGYEKLFNAQKQLEEGYAL